MADEKPFDITSAEQEIGRLNRPIKSVIWQAPKGESFTLSIPPTVYPPREDTDLLANAILGSVLDVEKDVLKLVAVVEHCLY